MSGPPSGPLSGERAADAIIDTQNLSVLEVLVMSIEIDQPSMALNSDDVPGTHYRMWNTWEVAANRTAADILGWTATVPVPRVDTLGRSS